MIDSVFEPDESSTNAVADSIALSESARMASDTLDADGQKKEHTRHQTFRNHVNWAALAIFWALAACVIVGLLTFVFHMLAPDRWHWLSEPQLDKLQTLLGAALLSSALTQYTNKRMS